MNSVEYALQASERLTWGLSQVDAEATEAMVDRICNAPHIFVAGAGRSLLMIRAFAMRLMHLGLPVYVVGETTTPALEAGDLLLIASGSGETSTLVLMAEKAQKLGAHLAVLTTYPQSSLGKCASVVVRLEGKVRCGENNLKDGQPGGSIFEHCALMLMDGMVLRIAEKRQLDIRQFRRHANLE